ncbi:MULTISPECIES: metal-dependent transcriptional regulator [Carnobacterium]|uniref:Manganese transport regulator n=1 Tax=Carnobacterium viridans TaxID=174587 RepID=A0A1H0XI04_9LACT|nr:MULTISPECIES: metal-dependent transcriptional regulator [Carnobacterium]SDQ02517.1 iron (metal) dependent repressor, DtxR family [Carnobacterium viridans]
MTPSKENYLKTIVELGGEKKIVNNKQLLTTLNVSAASVTDMNTKLLKENLIIHIPYKGVRVTEKGLHLANQVIRKHRIWEVFLLEKLEYDWKEVHAEADLLEHASSDELIERLYRFLGEPEFDPHGGYIPAKDSTTSTIQYSKLIDLSPGEFFAIKEVKDDQEFLEYLTSKEIKLRARYTLLSKEAYEGDLTLKDTDGSIIMISNKAAFKIYVEKIYI